MFQNNEVEEKNMPLIHKKYQEFNEKQLDEEVPVLQTIVGSQTFGSSRSYLEQPQVTAVSELTEYLNAERKTYGINLSPPF